MAANRSPIYELDCLRMNWTSLNNDGDVVPSTDRLNFSRILVGCTVKQDNFDSNNYLQVRLRHSDSPTSGFVDVPKEYLDGGPGVDGLIAEYKEDIGHSDGRDQRVVGYLGGKRYLIVRGDITGNPTNVRVGGYIMGLGARTLIER